MLDYKKEFIQFMLDCGVLTFGDFITKSGRSTPFFINTGNFKTGKQLKRLGEFYACAIKDNFGIDFDILFGPAYKGIPLSVSTCIALNELYNVDIAYCSNRKEVKDHGDTGILLGDKISKDSNIVIIEDVTTAGTSIHETMPIIKAQGAANIVGLIVSVDRMERGKGNKSALSELADEYKFKTCSIVTMDEVISYLHNYTINDKVFIDDNMKAKIDKYYDTYGVK